MRTVVLHEKSVNINLSGHLPPKWEIPTEATMVSNNDVAVTVTSINSAVVAFGEYFVGRFSLDIVLVLLLSLTLLDIVLVFLLSLTSLGIVLVSLLSSTIVLIKT